jgi:two-component system phosphate regulon sensor histidine kinase PhoR
MFSSTRWRIAIPYTALIALIMLGLTLYLSHLVRGAYIDELEGRLTDEAELLADALSAELLGPQSGQNLDAGVQRYAEMVGARVTVIAADGTVIGESHEDRSQMENHLYRPEVQGALSHGQGSSVRFSRTLGYDMLYVAVPISNGPDLLGFVRVALSLQQVESSVGRLRWAIFGAGLTAAAVAIVLAIVVAERTARPIRALTGVAERMAQGELGVRLFPTSGDEIGHLTRAFNHMADQLEDKLTALADERAQLAAVLENMADGVLIVDEEGRVELINPAAAQLLGSSPTEALGRSFAQVARHHEVIDFWKNCQEPGGERIGLLEIGPEALFWRVIVTPLEEKEKRPCLVILQDLTGMHRLQTMRQDFIGNISHELRTPLASLRALVETLRDGAQEDPVAAQRFLDLMETEVDALTQIVQESLELSRIESGRAPLRLSPTAVAEVILPVVERLRTQAERAGVTVHCTLPEGLADVLADEERVRQVVSNLLHNAIKFTPAGGEIQISAEQVADEVVISVRDTGVGISREDLPRVFERFYKADRARSSGGTGLGLAIAKHIIQAHGGRIWAQSIEGRGSTFHFSLPAVKQSIAKP